MANNIKPGDIVTGYHKGYWKVDKVSGSTVYYTRVDKKLSNACHRNYCKIIDPDKFFDDAVKEAGKMRELMLKAQACTAN